MNTRAWRCRNAHPKRDQPIADSPARRRRDRPAADKPRHTDPAVEVAGLPALQRQPRRVDRRPAAVWNGHSSCTPRCAPGRARRSRTRSGKLFPPGAPFR